MARTVPPWSGRCAVALGVPTVAVAVGLAPHWAKAGSGSARVLALGLAVVGVSLTVGGAIVATRHKRTIRRLASAGVVMVGLLLTTFVAAPAVAATHVPRPAIGPTPAAVGLRFRAVWLPTSDGVRLAAWSVESSNGAAVVLLHGAGSTRSDVLEHARVLADAGFGVLMVDARGHGASRGTAMDFGWYGDRDVAAATSFLRDQPDVDARIGAVGISMGGEEAVGASRTNPLLRAVVAEGATARTADDEQWLSDQYGLRGAVQEQLERAQDLITRVLTDAPVPASLRDAVHGSDDTDYLLITAGTVPDEAHAAAYVEAGRPERVETWTVRGAAHGAALDHAPDAWRRTVVGFLTRTLLR